MHKAVAASAAIILLAVIAFFLPSQNCKIKNEEAIVRGDSLTGLIEAGEKINIQYNYYACHPIERGDIAAYRYSGNREPIIKIVRGLPGDDFLLEPFQAKGYHLRINGLLAMTSRDEPYLFTDKRAELLKLYERDFGRTIPPDSYLILGNWPNGTVDSSWFGLVSKSDILGKVEKN